VISNIVSTQNPITNNEIDRFFEMLEALDFHAKENQALDPSLMLNGESRDISKSSVDILV